MIYLLHAGAVPIGYDRDMSDTYLSCWDEDCLPTTMDRGRLHETGKRESGDPRDEGEVAVISVLSLGSLSL